MHTGAKWFSLDSISQVSKFDFILISLKEVNHDHSQRLQLFSPLKGIKTPWKNGWFHWRNGSENMQSGPETSCPSRKQKNYQWLLLESDEKYAGDKIIVVLFAKDRIILMMKKWIL